MSIENEPRRCFGAGDATYSAYHDTEWGVPVHGESELLERLILEGFQTGLSWLTVLRRRDAFREAFAGFDPEIVANFTDDDVAHLLTDPRLIRNERKIRAAIFNARALVNLHEEGGTLDDLIWSHAPDRPRRPRSWWDVPRTTDQSKELTRSLKSAGFTWVGPVTVYATMQACGLVNDHIVGCPAGNAIDQAG
ncbi:MAG: DNA-3-methyladenine glycosylase I [Bifidobacteriaceae bacterium]|nr:DNA-3-methyladenine glycosylase I [Bifidobacteriaceae bacterium]